MQTTIVHAKHHLNTKAAWLKTPQVYHGVFVECCEMNYLILDIDSWNMDWKVELHERILEYLKLNVLQFP